jgi:DNA-binding Xre family transcriptional regulator
MHTPKLTPTKNPHDGSTLDDFLLEEGILEEVEAAAIKRAIALKIVDLMREKDVQKVSMAKQMRTSRAALDRLLDPENTSVTLATLTRAAHALGRKIKIDLVPA